MQASAGVLPIGLGAFHRAHKAYCLDGRRAGYAHRGLAVGNLRHDGVTALRGWSESLAVNRALTRCHHLPRGREAVMTRFRDPGVRLITVPLSERGYRCVPGSRAPDAKSAEVRAALAAPDAPCTMSERRVARRDPRRRSGAGPVKVVSCDNLRPDGEVLRPVVLDSGPRALPEPAPRIAAHVRFSAWMMDGAFSKVREADRQARTRRIPPDEPPFPVFGLPRVVCDGDDLARIPAAHDSPGLGLTSCAGSLGALAGNKTAALFAGFGSRMNFLHLRKVRTDGSRAFFEDAHLSGNTDMSALIAQIPREECRRKDDGWPDWEIPVRPDHGHLNARDAGLGSPHGYSHIRRLKELAELRGVVAGVLPHLHGT